MNHPFAGFADFSAAQPGPCFTASVIHTVGRSYRKAGAKMILCPETQSSFGMLSGGCFEADIMAHCAELTNDHATLLHYDFNSFEDQFYGTGIGCPGELYILIEPFARSRTPGPLPAGRRAIELHRQGKSNRYRINSLPTDPDTRLHWSKGPEVMRLSEAWPAQPILAVIGGGEDAAKLTDYGIDLGWHARNYRFSEWSDAQTALEKADKHRRALVIMTHNLEHDQKLMQDAGVLELDYLGVMGTHERLAKMDCTPKNIYCPIGLNLGGRAPAAVALSIAAEIQAVFHDKVAINR